jgi:serine/threonine protein kinase
MRLCPKCGKTYADDVFACEHDGGVLVPGTPDAAWVPVPTSGLTYRPESIPPLESKTLVGNESTIPKYANPAGETTSAVSDHSEDGFTSVDVELVDGLGAVRLSRRFRPILQIAKGGMGRIYLVEERDSGRFVALKLMTGNGPSLVQQFIREGIITARLEHPNIIPVYELGFLSAGQLYFTMRYIESIPLSELMPRIDLRARVRILRDAARAVAFAHGQGLWHRDVKPDNILVGRFGDVYVVDWGLVTVQHGMKYRLDLPRIVVDSAIYELEVERFLARTGDALTATGSIFAGTPSHMAPEQLMADDSLMGATSDVWAFGVMLFRAITGQHPVLGMRRSARPDELLQAIRERGIRDARELVPDAPVELARLCQGMLETDCRHRISLEVFIGEASIFLEKPGSTT